MRRERSKRALMAALAVAAGAVQAVQPAAIHAGCHSASDGRCRVRVAPFIVSADPGQPLRRLQLRFNTALAYDFATDVSNPPFGSYAPSAVATDFAARCGAAYSVSLWAQDGDDPELASIGQTATFTCPATPRDDAIVFGDGFEAIGRFD